MNNESKRERSARGFQDFRLQVFSVQLRLQLRFETDSVGQCESHTGEARCPKSVFTVRRRA